MERSIFSPSLLRIFIKEFDKGDGWIKFVNGRLPRGMDQKLEGKKPSGSPQFSRGQIGAWKQSILDEKSHRSAVQWWRGLGFASDCLIGSLQPGTESHHLPAAVRAFVSYRTSHRVKALSLREDYSDFSNLWGFYSCHFKNKIKYSILFDTKPAQPMKKTGHGSTVNLPDLVCCLKLVPGIFSACFPFNQPP